MTTAELRARYLSAQLRGDRRAALLVLEDARGLSVPQLQREVVAEAQREVGRLWEENRITIAQEHMATAISQVALAHLYERAAAGAPNGKLALVACVEGELHAFPAQIVADTLDLAGFGVRFLGADVPTDALLRMIDELRPDLLALSCAMPFNLPALREAVRRVRARPGPRLPICAGGNAVQAAQLPDLDLDGTGADAGEMLALARKLTGAGHA